jgi:peptide deformylase
MEILKVGDPILAQKCEPVTDIASIKDAIAEMKTIINTPETAGLGLAAPQVGISQSFFVIRDYIESMVDNMMDKPVYAVINPQIKKVYPKRVYFKEGCLSVPGKAAYVERAKELKVKYTDEDGKLQSRHLTGATAIVFQHEYDHLIGRTMLDVAFKVVDLPKSQEEVPEVEVYPQVEETAVEPNGEVPTTEA